MLFCPSGGSPQYCQLTIFWTERGDFGGKLPFLGFRTIIRTKKIDFKQEKWATRQKIHKTQFRSILLSYHFLKTGRAYSEEEPTFLGFKCNYQKTKDKQRKKITCKKNRCKKSKKLKKGVQYNNFFNNFIFRFLKTGFQPILKS